MKLKDYIAGLKTLVEKRPELAEFEVVTSKDDEGNGYNTVHFGPSVGHFDAQDEDFSQDDGLEANAVCVN